MSTYFNPSGAVTSGTFNFFPSNAGVIESAFARIGKPRTELTETMLLDGVAELNFYLTSFNDLGPNLAQVDLQSFTMVQGQATYTVPTNTVTILDVYVSFGSPTIDRYLYGLSRTEYAAIPNKTQQATPTQYWFDRTANPTLTFYFVPDGNGPYTLNYYRFRQVQDATIANGVQPEVPNRALDCLVAGLSHRLSRIYARDLEAQRKADAAEAWAIYAKQDTEFAPMYLMPGLHGYWRP